jgi:thiamine-monophosphate kinase
VLRGIGDDCAVLAVPTGHEALITTDLSLEGVHFRREWHPPDAVGYRCLARGLSDIAAMAGDPIAAFLSLAVPVNLPQHWIDRFLDGFLRLAKSLRVTLAGGDVAESPTGILADIIVLGSVPRGAAILRSGARPGDAIYVTGELGGSAAAVQMLLSRQKKYLKSGDYPRHFYPAPRVAVARELRQQKLPSAMIDISDGLSTDLEHICEESRVGAVLEGAAIPLAKVGREQREVNLLLALHGGEDYELLFTAPAGRRVPARIAGVRITKVGHVVRRPGIKLTRADGTMEPLLATGWQHFNR